MPELIGALCDDATRTVLQAADGAPSVRMSG